MWSILVVPRRNHLDETPKKTKPYVFCVPTPTKTTKKKRKLINRQDAKKDMEFGGKIKKKIFAKAKEFQK